MTTGRLEAFSDGVFAIAITLLVLDLHVPRSSDSPTGQLLGAALLRQWPAYFAYATSFVTILIMWVNHHHIIARLAKADHTFLFLNGLLLMAVSVVPFPTSILAEYLQRPGQTVAAAVYTGTFVILALLYNLWWHYAAHDRRLLHQSVHDGFVASVSRQYYAAPVIYLLAFVLAFINVWASVAVCGLLALFFALPFGHRAQGAAGQSDEKARDLTRGSE